MTQHNAASLTDDDLSAIWQLHPNNRMEAFERLAEREHSSAPTTTMTTTTTDSAAAPEPPSRQPMHQHHQHQHHHHQEQEQEDFQPARMDAMNDAPIADHRAEPHPAQYPMALSASALAARAAQGVRIGGDRHGLDADSVLHYSSSMGSEPVATSSRLVSLLTLAVVYTLAAAPFVVLPHTLPTHTHPLQVMFLELILSTVIVFVFSVMYDNSSLYDPYWALAPIPAAFWFAFGNHAFWQSERRGPTFRSGGFGAFDPTLAAHPIDHLNPPLAAGGPSQLRQLVLLAVLIVWSVRFVFCSLRRWQGLHHEDWRYADLRDTFPAGLYWAVSALAVHLMPSIAVFVGCLPLYPALVAGASEFNLLDVIAAALCLAAVMFETRADSQLQRFRRKGKGRPGEVLATGLWEYSRHPTYFGRVLFWWGLWLFGVAASFGRPFPSYTLLGPLAVTLLYTFVAIPLVERRLERRRPGFIAYRARTPMIVPWPPSHPTKSRQH